MGSGLSRFRRPDQIKTPAQGIPQPGLDLFHRQPRPPVAQTTHPAAPETAGGDQLKPAQLTGDIQGEAVLGDPAAASSSDGRHLAILQPDTGKARDALSNEVEIRQHIQQHLLQLTQIPMKIGLVTAEIQHRIGNQLAWQMVRHLTAAINPVQRSRRILRIEVKMIRTGTPTERVTGRMLQQPDRLRVAWMLKETLLPAPLIAPGLLEQHRIHRLKKNCGAGVGRIAVRI